MQLYLKSDEWHLLADILLKRVDTMPAPISPAGSDVELNNDFRSLRPCDHLLEKVLARDLRLDSELTELMADFLFQEEQELNEVLAGQQDTAYGTTLKRRLGLVEHVSAEIHEIPCPRRPKLQLGGAARSGAARGFRFLRHRLLSLPWFC